MSSSALPFSYSSPVSKLSVQASTPKQESRPKDVSSNGLGYGKPKRVDFTVPGSSSKITSAVKHFTININRDPKPALMPNSKIGTPSVEAGESMVPTHFNSDVKNQQSIARRNSSNAHEISTQGGSEIKSNKLMSRARLSTDSSFWNIGFYFESLIKEAKHDALNEPYNRKKEVKKDRSNQQQAGKDKSYTLKDKAKYLSEKLSKPAQRRCYK